MIREIYDLIHRKLQKEGITIIDNTEYNKTQGEKMEQENSSQINNILNNIKKYNAGENFAKLLSYMDNTEFNKFLLTSNPVDIEKLSDMLKNYQSPPLDSDHIDYIFNKIIAEPTYILSSNIILTDKIINELQIKIRTHIEKHRHSNNIMPTPFAIKEHRSLPKDIIEMHKYFYYYMEIALLEKLLLKLELNKEKLLNRTKDKK